METTKFRSQLSIAMEQVFLWLLRAEHALATWRNMLHRATAKSEDFLIKLRAISREAAIFTKTKINAIQFHLSSASKRLAVPVRRARNTAGRLARGAVDTARRVSLETRNDMDKLQSASRNAAVFAGAQIAKVGSNVSDTTKQIGGRIHVAQSNVTGFVKSAVDEPRRRRAARRAKEDELHHLLSSSLDAIVVTDVNRRLVEANPRALELFGISEFNMKYFTIDTFLARYEALRNASPVSSKEEIHRWCRIRRLDGALRVAECHFVPEVVARRHLFEFLHIAPYKITPFGFAARNGTHN